MTESLMEVWCPFEVKVGSVVMIGMPGGADAAMDAFRRSLPSSAQLEFLKWAVATNRFVWTARARDPDLKIRMIGHRHATLRPLKFVYSAFGDKLLLAEVVQIAATKAQDAVP
jgi:type IV secretory pathway TrbD component